MDKNSIIRQTQEPNTALDDLGKQLRLVKQTIVDHRAKQGLLEERIAQLVGVKEEGTISCSTKNWKISTTGGLNRTLEFHDVDHYKSQLGDRFDDLISVKLSIKVAALRRATQEEQEIMMQHALMKPKKVAVKVEPREES